MSYFHDAVVSHNGQEFSFTVEEGRARENGLNYWHSSGDPSTWLVVAIFQAARTKTGDAPEAVALELAARALGITVEKLHNLIQWHEEYMRWHDGDSEYKVLSD